MAQGAPDFVSGKHVRFKFYLNGAPVIVFMKDTDIEEDAEEIADDVNGEDRSRLQKLTNFYRCQGQVFTPDKKLLEAWITNQANEDANEPQLDAAAGIRVEFLDGSAAAFVMKKVTVGPLKLRIGGRKERVMQNLALRFQYFDETQAA
jgi:hypothetical protein